jgi:Tfp pilus assembly protein PilF
VFVRAPGLISAVALAAALAVSPAAAEPLGSHFQITPFGGFTRFDPAVQPTGTGSLRDAGYAGARIGWQPRSLWGLELAGGVTPTSVEQTGGAGVTFMHLSGNILLTPLSRRHGGPFLSIGAGAARFKPSSGTNLDQSTLDVAAGVRLWLTDAMGLRFEARDIHYLPKYSNQSSADHLVLGVGLTLALGATPRNTHADAVPNVASSDPMARGLTLEALGVLESDPVRAEELLQSALKADPFDGPAHNDLGVLYLRQSKLYEAANEFEQARKLMPGNPDPRLNLGLTFERAGLNERAFSAYDAALEASPTHIRTIQAVASLTLRTDRTNARLTGMLEDIALRGETSIWRNWAKEQLSRLKH